MVPRFLYLFVLVTLSPNMDQQLWGTWKYVDCTIKNTHMEGTVTFYSDGSFELKAIGHDDCPVPTLNGKYQYETSKGKFVTNYKKGYGFATYYLVEKDFLYFNQ